MLHSILRLLNVIQKHLYQQRFSVDLLSISKIFFVDNLSLSQGLLVSFWPSSDFFKYSSFCCFNVIWWSVFVSKNEHVSRSQDLQVEILDGTMETFQ